MRKIVVVEIPDDVDWYIDNQDMDGYECVVEKHRTWGVIRKVGGK